jgi:hypothetical protein
MRLGGITGYGADEVGGLGIWASENIWMVTGKTNVCIYMYIYINKLTYG